MPRRILLANPILVKPEAMPPMSLTASSPTLSPRAVLVRAAAAAMLTSGLAMGPTLGAAQVATTLPPMSAAPVIDGKVSPDEMGACAKITLNVIGGVDRPKDPTSVYMGVTREALYVGFVCEDRDPAAIKVAAKDGGAVFDDDSIQFLFCPAAETTRDNYYHFSVNASGARYSSEARTDLPVRDWTRAVSRNAKGWECELLIPLSTVKANFDTRYWRANIARERPMRASGPTASERETSAWCNPGMSLHNYRRFGYLMLNNVTASMSMLDGGTTAAAASRL